MSLSSFLREKVRTFAEHSSVAGFGEIRRSTNALESIFWSATIVVCVYLTIRDCATPILGYMNEASLSTINVVFNNTVHFPGSSICVEIDTSKLPIRSLSTFENASLLASFAACLNDEDCFKNATFFSEFRDQIYAAAKLLSRYYVLENGIKHQLNLTEHTLDGIPDAFSKIIATDDRLPRQLATTLGYIFCAQMRMQIKYARKNDVNVTDVCSTATLVWFGVPARAPEETDLLCYNIERFMNFSSMDVRYELTFDPSAAMSVREPKNHLAYLSVDGVPVTSDLTSNYVSVSFDKCLHVELDLITRITLLSKRGKPCDAHTSGFECYGRCSVREITRRCNCSSVSWQLYITDEDDVNISCIARFWPPNKYTACAREAHDHPENKQCRKRCLPLCEQNIFHLVQTTECEYAEQQPNRTTVVYRLYRLFYSHVEEQLQYDVSTLFSSLGGIVGLWLGAGFIGILEAVIFLPKALADYARCWHLTTSKREEAETLNEANERIAGLEARILALEAVNANKEKAENAAKRYVADTK